MPSYDASHFEPPAPIAQVTLRNPHTGELATDVLLLVDTGADITLLPRLAVEQLGVPLLTNQRYELMGFDGSKSFAPVVMLDMISLTRAFRGQYLLIEEERGILGRDILNHVILLLNGPRQQWSKHAPKEQFVLQSEQNGSCCCSYLRRFPPCLLMIVSNSYTTKSRTV